MCGEDWDLTCLQERLVVGAAAVFTDGQFIPEDREEREPYSCMDTVAGQVGPGSPPPELLKAADVQTQVCANVLEYEQ